MKMTKFSSVVVALICTVVYTSCSKVDINNEQDVLKDIQGTWVGYEKNPTGFTHIKLNISEDSFDGWVQNSDSEKEPVWSILPGETGTISLSSVIVDPNGSSKIRKFSFSVSGRCCGDKSLVVESLSKLLSYNEGKGLYVADKLSMIKK